MNHVVNRLRFEIGCGDEEQAFDIRANVAPSLQALALEAIDTVCSRHVAEDDLLHIDRIEVDLGGLSVNGIERNFLAEFRARFETELVKRLAARGSEVAPKALADRRFELFRYVLMHGALPWWAAPEDADLDLLAQQMQAERPAELRAFLAVNAADAHLWRRAAWQLRDAGRRALIAAHEPLHRAYARLEMALKEAVDAARASPRHDRDAPMSLVAAREALLSRAAELADGGQVEARLAEVVSEIVATPSPPSEAAPAAPTRDATVPRRDAEGGARALAAVLAAVSESPPAPAAEETRMAREEPEEARYLVRHAGLVLLAPFMVRFFEACELLDEARWRTKEDQYTAVHLLKYLCTGAQRYAEHDLTLEKLCCGVSIEEPIPRDFDLDDRSTAEAQSLLAAVLTHWTALKRTSVEGLRETYLKRDGLVLRRERDWLLRVERKTVDVLIDSIPWGYSTLAMPWNNYVIHVEW